MILIRLKRTAIKVTTFALFTMLLACSVTMTACGREELYDIAAHGVPLIYSLSDDGAEGLLVVSNGGDYYGEYIISGYGIPAGSDILHVNNRLRAFVARGNQAYTHDSPRYSDSWSPRTLPNTINWIDSSGSNTFFIINTVGDCLYRWDDSGNTAVSQGKTIGDAPVVLRYEPAAGAWFVAAEQGGNTPVYVVTEAPALQLVITSLASLPRFFLRVYSGNVYVGRADGIYINDLGGAYYTGVGIQSYASYGETSYYAAGINGSLVISRLEGTAFVTDYAFVSGAGDIEIAVFDSDHLAVGIAGSASDDGLYLYNRKKKTIKRINYRPSYSLFVR